MSLRFILPAIFAGFCLASLPASAHAKGYLGIQIRLNRTENPDGKGFLIVEVLARGPAAKAGLKPDDIIVRIDGTEPTSLAEFVKIIERKQPGLEVTLDILRDGKEKKVKVTIGEKNNR
jgi:S1-C subfamily serine protease